MVSLDYTSHVEIISRLNDDKFFESTPRLKFQNQFSPILAFFTKSSWNFAIYEKYEKLFLTRTFKEPEGEWYNIFELQRQKRKGQRKFRSSAYYTISTMPRYYSGLIYGLKERPKESLSEPQIFKGTTWRIDKIRILPTKLQCYWRSRQEKCEQEKEYRRSVDENGGFPENDGVSRRKTGDE